MQLDQLSVVLRQRNPWEAIDLGFAMVREWWRDAYAAWLTVFVPVSVAACWLLPPLWAFVLVWWLKPALDRIVLHVVASAVFGSRPRLREALRSFFSYARNGLIRSLLPPFRFSLTRSFDLPVRQLENARGHTARLRSKQLHRRVMNQASWLTVVCLHFEAVVFLSLVGLYDMLVPAATQDSFNPFEVFQATQNHTSDYLVTALYLAAIALIEPLYVAGGFALYLNRRTALEGWDLEVQLRRIAQRAEQSQGHALVATGSAITAAVGIGLAVAAGDAGRLSRPGCPFAERKTHPAQQIPEAPRPAVPPRSQAKQQIIEVLKDPQFQQFETRTLIEPLHKPEADKPRRDNTGFASFMQLVAEILRGVVWVLLGGCAALRAVLAAAPAELDPRPGALAMDAAGHVVRAGRAARESAARRGGGRRTACALR